MRNTIKLLFVALFTATCFLAQAQGTKDACSLISDEQLNKLIGCNIKQSGSSIMKGARCAHKSADFKAEITIEYYDWKSEKTAQDMLKMTSDQDRKSIADTKKAAAIYTAFKDFAAGGKSAFIMTGPGDIYTNGNVVRFQFALGTAVFTVDTKGIDMNKVVPGLEKIYAIIKTSYK